MVGDECSSRGSVRLIVRIRITVGVRVRVMEMVSVRVRFKVRARVWVRFRVRGAVKGGNEAVQAAAEDGLGLELGLL